MNRTNWKSEYFVPEEWECKCGCKTLNVKNSFFKKIERARKIAETIDKNNCSFIITSGCRCEQHNKNIGGKEFSLHRSSETIETHGVDIFIPTDRKRAVILLALVKTGFTHIGIGKDFVHVDDSLKKGVWLYG